MKLTCIIHFGYRVSRYQMNMEDKKLKTFRMMQPCPKLEVEQNNHEQG